MSEKLRVLHVTEVPAGGVGHSLVDLLTGQIERGYDVTVVYSAERVDKNFLAFLETKPNARFIVIPMHRSIHFSDLSVIMKVRRILRDEGPFDIIHGHSSKGGAYARLARVGRKIVCIYSTYAIYTLNPLLNRIAFQFFRAVELGLSLLTDQIVVDSTAEDAHMLELGFPRSRVTYIRNALGPLPPIDKLEARKLLGLPESAIIIGSVGKLEVQKDPELLIRSFGELARRNSDAILAIAGAGPMLQDLQQLARDCGVQDRVLFLGFQPGVQVIAACDIYTLTSHYEGLVYVLMEALAIGRPIVTTDIVVAHCLVDDGVNGLIVSKRDPVDFGAALLSLVEDADRRRAFADASQRKSKEFDLSKKIEDNLKLYEKLLPPGRKTALGIGNVL